MLGRGVDGRELQRAIARVLQVVPGAAGDEDSVPRTQAAALPVLPAFAQREQGLPFLHAEELVQLRVYLRADLPAHGDAHQRHLQMTPRPDSPAEAAVFQGGGVYIHAVRSGTAVRAPFLLSGLPT